MSNSKHWQGGSTWAWRKIRLAVLQRDQWRCQLQIEGMSAATPLPPPEEHWEVQVRHSPCPNGKPPPVLWSTAVSDCHEACGTVLFPDRGSAAGCARKLLGSPWPAVRLKRVTVTYEPVPAASTERQET